MYATTITKLQYYKNTEMRNEKIVVPATPGGVLAQRLQDIADKEAIPGLKFKVVEKGGKTFERILTKSNPTATGNCGRTDKHGNMDCVPCSQDGGGQDGV